MKKLVHGLAFSAFCQHFVCILWANLRNIINLFVVQNNNNKKQQVMETTFEKLNDQEMINVVGGLERVVRYTDEHGNVFYIIIRENVDDEAGN